MLGRDQVRRSVALQAGDAWRHSGVNAGQDQNDASGMCVEEKESRHSASRDAMWGTLKCHRN